MDENNITINLPCNISGRLFARFAMYDTFVRKKAWKSPLLFAVLMGVFATVCFTVLKDREQASLLGMVLLSVGLLLPVVWVFMYILSVRNQIKKSKLSEYKTTYIVELDNSAVHVTNGKEKADFKWEDIVLFVDAKECAFMYVENGKAFILPNDENWNNLIKLVTSKVDQSKLRIKNKF